MVGYVSSFFLSLRTSSVLHETNRPSSRFLQERGEGRAREKGEALLERLNLCVARRDTCLEILHQEIAAFVEVRVDLVELLEFRKHLVARGFSIDEILLRLRLFRALRHDVFVLLSERLRSVFSKLFKRRLSLLFAADGLGLHGLRVVDDLLDHTHDTAWGGTFLVGLEAWGRRLLR